MERKEIEKRYENIINSFRNKIKDKTQLKYVIKNIERDVNAYETTDITNKKNLGIAILIGLGIFAAGISIGTNEFTELWKEIGIKLAGLGFDAVGIYAILKGIGHYSKDKKDLNAFAEESIENFEAKLNEESYNARTK